MRRQIRSNDMTILVKKDRKHFILKMLLIYIALICISIALQSVANYNFFLEELSYLSSPYYDLKGTAKATVYLVSYVISIGLILIVLIERSTILWFILLTYILIAYFVDASIQLIGSRSGFTNFQYILFLDEAHHYKNLLIFLSEFKKALLITGILGAALILIRRYARIRISSWWIFLAPLYFVAVVVAKMGVYYIAYVSYPSPIKIPIIIANYHLKKVEQPARVLAQDIVAGQNQRNNIILIIDESVSGNHLSINGYDKSTTPDLEEYVKQGVITNYGVVNSVANCSALSHLVLRIGLSSNTKNADTDFIATRRSLPTIYQYAKRAGYQTWLIDAQNRTDQGALQNYLTYDDLKYIDTYITRGTRTEDYKRDRIALEELKTIMKEHSEKNKFIVFIKDGAHWPYLWRFPESQTLFRPIQTTEYEPRIKENKEKLINTYANLMRYTVNDFLKLYIKEVDRKNTITFYTSDHGQAFLEAGAKDNLTHCSSFYDPSSSQVAVPLLIIDSSVNKRYVPDVHKLYSQDQIFPSMLMEMGYSDDITKRYGKTLLNGYPENTERWFYWSMEGDRSLYKPNVSSPVK